MASLRFVNIGDCEYAVGLWWQVRHSGPAPRKVILDLARKTAREFEKEQYNLVAIRPQQFGLGQSSEAPDKCHALAGAIRMRREVDSFLCIFNLADDFWWVCSISKGIIAANGDTWHSTREEAEKAAHSQQQLIEGDFVLYDTPEESLAALEPLLSPERALEPLFPNPDKRKRQIQQILLFAASIALIFVGFSLFNKLKEQETMRQLRYSLDARAKHEDELRRYPERIFAMPWQNAPLVTAAGTQCANAILNQPSVYLGWSLADMFCAPGDSLAVYRAHNIGASYIDLPEKMNFVTAQKTVQSVSLPRIPTRPSVPHTSLPTRKQVTAVIFELTQALKANLEIFGWEPPEQTIRGDVQLSAPWQSGKFTISGVPHSMVASGLVFKALEQHGLILTSIVYKATVKNWTIQGEAYARL